MYIIIYGYTGKQNGEESPGVKK